MVGKKWQSGSHFNLKLSFVTVVLYLNIFYGLLGIFPLNIFGLMPSVHILFGFLFFHECF